jgi:hypothetical protein
MLNRHQLTIFLFSILIVALFASVPSPVAGGANLGHQIYAIPAFSRQYGTSCSTCHVDFPKLNDFGKAFKDAGFKFPKDDETFLKIPPVMLGSQAQKELWPHTIWPGTIPGIPPIGLRFNTFFQVVGRNRNNFNLQTPGDPAAAFIPRTDFQSGLFSIFMAGNFGGDIAFWVDDDISVGGASAGGLGDGYLKFVNIGHHLKLPTDSLSLRVGQFELDLPFSQARTWNLSGWDIYDQGNIGTVNSTLGSPTVNNLFAMGNAAQGVEFSGGHTYRGYHYSLAIVNQNTGGTAGAGNNVPPVVAYTSDSNFKDIYARFSYRFNLERDPASRDEIQAAGATGPRDHTYLNLGTLYFYGRSVQRFQGQDSTGVLTVLTAREPFYRVGGDFTFNYHALNFFGQYMYGRDQNVLPLLPAGFQPPPTGLLRGSPVSFSGGFLEADYLALPWLMTIMRWDVVHSTADLINGLGATPDNDIGSFVSPFHTTRNRFTPGVQFLIHANIKASFEYQIRPEQIVYVPTTSKAITSPFRTNSAIAGLEFVY